MGAWSLKQRFAFRASTVLYLAMASYTAFFLLLDQYFPELTRRPSLVLWIALCLPFLIVLTASLSLSFFVSSIIGRNPQIQFLLEGFLAFAIGLPVVMPH